MVSSTRGELNFSSPPILRVVLIWNVLSLFFLPSSALLSPTLSFSARYPTRLRIKDQSLTTTRLLGTSTSNDTTNNNKNERTQHEGNQDDISGRKVAETFLENFERSWKTLPGNQVVQQCFVQEITPFWRDMVAFTWNIATQEGTIKIAQALDDKGVLGQRSKCHFELAENPLPLRQYTQDGDEILEFWADSSVDASGTGKAHFRLVKPMGNQINQVLPTEYRIHTLLTTLLELLDRPFQVGSNRIRGHEAGAIRNRKYWPERRQENDSNEPYVVVIGGGQAGLALGARLHLLSIPYVILESGTKPGTAWRKRYPSLHLHDPVWYNHMPYLPFPETWPVLCPGIKIAEWMEFYAKALDLNVETNSRVLKVQQSEGSSDVWEVLIQEKLDPDEAKKTTTKTRTISAQHVVFATGNSSKPKIPQNIPGKFMGLQLHSSQYRGGRPHAGKRVIVVGSNNSGWDIVQDLWEQGADHVTMIQRSPSMVVSTNSVLTHGLGALYREDAPLAHEDADLVATSVPFKLLIPRWKAVNQKMKETDHNLLKNLSEAGYQLDDGPDGAGIFAKSATEGGGFYIDMGCADLVIRKAVQVRYATVSRLEPDGVVIQDKATGEEEYLPADVIIYATGFETLDQWMATLCGEEISKRVGRTWGLGLGKRPKDPCPWEGELRNMWKPTAVDGLWFHGGNLAQSRHYSRFLALQLAARYMDIPTPVFGVPKPTEPTK